METTKPELPLEVQLRLARWKLEIQNLRLDDLQALFMMLAQESAEKQMQYEGFIKELMTSERNYQLQLNRVEKQYAVFQTRLLEILRSDNLE